MDTASNSAEQYTNLRLNDLSLIPNWYPHEFPRTRTLKTYREFYSEIGNNEIINVVESVAGRIEFIRSAGSKIYFIMIESNGIYLQVLANMKHYLDQQHFETIMRVLRRGDIIGATGYPTRSAKGELSILPTNVVLLAPCMHCIPKSQSGFSDVGLRFQQRYLDLMMRPANRQIIKTRAFVNKFIRKYLDDRDFIEVETPIICGKTGGANAQPFITHHNDLDKKMAMRIAPELFLKQLIIGGFERIYELGKQFRNESINFSHSPEFSSIEIYQAYADYTNMLQLIEELLSSLVMELNGSYILKYDMTNDLTKECVSVEIDFTPPFKRFNLITDLEIYAGFTFPKEILEDFGSDNARNFLIDICARLNVECSNPKTTARLLDKLVGAFLEPKCINPTFIMFHPQIMSPLAKYHRDNKFLTERFELFIVQMEFANAYTELNDPSVQKKCFINQAVDRENGDDEAQIPDDDYIKALEYGLPPTSGLGIGMDRLIMLLTNQSSIREVITFRPY